MLVSPVEYNTWTFLGGDFQMVAVFSSLLGSTADTCLCQSTEAWGCVKVDLGS